jgi:hypothetical protein
MIEWSMPKSVMTKLWMWDSWHMQILDSGAEWNLYLSGATALRDLCIQTCVTRVLGDSSSEFAKGTWIFTTGAPRDYIHNPPSLGDPAT